MQKPKVCMYLRWSLILLFADWIYVELFMLWIIIFSASPSINQSSTVCARSKWSLSYGNISFWTFFRSKGLRLKSKEAKFISTKWLCRFYMISHGYLEYDSQKKVLRKFVFAMWCDFVLYFCLLFEENTFFRAAKKFFLLSGSTQKSEVHV